MKYETHEVPISELIRRYVATLKEPEKWKVLAIDLFTDVLILKREINDEQEEAVEVKQE